MRNYQIEELQKKGVSAYLILNKTVLLRGVVTFYLLQ